MLEQREEEGQGLQQSRERNQLYMEQLELSEVRETMRELTPELSGDQITDQQLPLTSEYRSINSSNDFEMSCVVLQNEPDLSDMYSD